MSTKVKDPFVLVSKNAGKHGRKVLISFASKPLWKDYEEMRRQNEVVPYWHDKQTMQHALNKYANNDSYELLPTNDIGKEFNDYKTTFPNWQ